MHLECPSCKKSNEIEFSKHIHCHSCNKDFHGHFFRKFKKPLLSTGTAIFLTVIGTYKIDKEFIEEPRLPLEVEFEIVDHCVNSSSFMTSSWRRNKTEICTCALKLTTKEIDYSDINKHPRKFMSLIEKNTNLCS